MITEKLTTRIVVAVCGADTRVGVKLTEQLRAAGLGVLPRPVSWALETPPRKIRQELNAKKPAVVVNCLVDPDGGDMPARGVVHYLNATASLLSQCKAAGSRYVHVSSARIYGPLDQPESGKAYGEYDAVLLDVADPWRQLIAATERLVMSQTMHANPVATKATCDTFGFYVARFGHVLDFSELFSQRHPQVTPLSVCLTELANGRDTVVCENPEVLLSPLSSTFAAKVLVDLSKPSCTAPYGFYNLGSSSPVSLRELCRMVTMRNSGFASFVPAARRHADLSVYGVDTNQAVSSELWHHRGMRRVPTWQAAIRPLLMRDPLVAA